MPKKLLNESVLHDWIHGLTFQMQALLLTGMRGPDHCKKENIAKVIVRYLRGVVIKPAGPWKGDNDNDFMWGDYNRFQEYREMFFEDHDEFPHHFIMHLVHCAEVIGYYHPVKQMRWEWNKFYQEACISFHMIYETPDMLEKRLNDFGCGIHNQKK